MGGLPGVVLSPGCIFWSSHSRFTWAHALLGGSLCASLSGEPGQAGWTYTGLALYILNTITSCTYFKSILMHHTWGEVGKGLWVYLFIYLFINAPHSFTHPQPGGAAGGGWGTPSPRFSSQFLCTTLHFLVTSTHSRDNVARQEPSHIVKGRDLRILRICLRVFTFQRIES